MSLTVTELEILAGLGEGRTLTEIAAGVYLGQPAITRALQALRRKAGVPLVERRGRRVYLTPLGLEVAHSAKQLLLTHRDLEHRIEALRSGTAGTLNLIATTTPSTFLLPGIVGELLRQSFEIRVNLRTATPEEIWDVFVTERYDLGIGPPLVPGSTWTAEELYQDEVTFFVTPDSPLARQGLVTWEELELETLVGPFSATYWDKMAESRLRGVRRIDVGAIDAVKHIVEASGAVGMLLSSAVRREIQEGRLTRLRLEGQPTRQPFWVARRSAPYALPVLEQLDALLRQRVRELYGAPAWARRSSHA